MSLRSILATWTTFKIRYLGSKMDREKYVVICLFTIHCMVGPIVLYIVVKGLNLKLSEYGSVLEVLNVIMRHMCIYMCLLHLDKLMYADSSSSERDSYF